MPPLTEPTPGSRDPARLPPRQRAALTAGGAALALLLSAAPTAAKEIDSFTHRYSALAFPVGEVGGEPVADFTGELNGLVNRIFADTLERINLENRRLGRSCEAPAARRRLYTRLSKALGGYIYLTRNRLRPALNQHPMNFKITLPRSIYRDFPPWRSISLGLISKFDDKMAEILRFDLTELLVESGGRVEAAGETLRVHGLPGGETALYALTGAGEPVVAAAGRTYYLLANGQAVAVADGRVSLVTPILVGSDKFSHFFNRSLKLYRRLRRGQPQQMDAVLDYNYGLEVSIWGSRSTGVAAYGDLVANFQGMRFWIRLRGESIDGHPLADPLGADSGFVACSRRSGWSQTRPIDFADYLDPAWDEGLNCSLMRSHGLLAMVSRQIRNLEEADGGRSYSCPVEPAIIRATAKRYGRFAPRLINADGHRSLAAPRATTTLSAEPYSASQRPATAGPD